MWIDAEAFIASYWGTDRLYSWMMTSNLKSEVEELKETGARSGRSKIIQKLQQDLDEMVMSWDMNSYSQQRFRCLDRDDLETLDLKTFKTVEEVQHALFTPMNEGVLSRVQNLFIAEVKNLCSRTEKADAGP